MSKFHRCDLSVDLRGGRRGLRSAAEVLGIAVASVLSLAPLAARADCVWNVSSGSWETAVDWTGGLPTSADNADIYNNGTATVTKTGDVCTTSCSAAQRAAERSTCRAPAA